jgi:hypothetical protein
VVKQNDRHCDDGLEEFGLKILLVQRGTVERRASAKLGLVQGTVNTREASARLVVAENVMTKGVLVAASPYRAVMTALWSAMSKRCQRYPVQVQLRTIDKTQTTNTMYMNSLDGL